MKNIVELEVKVEKNNCDRLQGRCKLIEIKHMFFRNFPCYF